MTEIQRLENWLQALEDRMEKVDASILEQAENMSDLMKWHKKVMIKLDLIMTILKKIVGVK